MSAAEIAAVAASAAAAALLVETLRQQLIDAETTRDMARLQRAGKQLRRALPPAANQRRQEQTQGLRDRLRERDKQIRELNGKLLATEKAHQKLLAAHEPAEQKLRA